MGPRSLYSSMNIMTRTITPKAQCNLPLIAHLTTMRRSVSKATLSDPHQGSSRRKAPLRGSSSDQLSSFHNTVPVVAVVQKNANSPTSLDSQSEHRLVQLPRGMERRSVVPFQRTAVMSSSSWKPRDYERSDSDASLDPTAAPKRGRRRLDRNRSSTTPTTYYGGSFRSLNSSMHSNASSDDFSFDEPVTSWQDKPRPKKGSWLLTTLGLLAFLCVAGIFVAQNYVAVTGPLSKRLDRNSRRAKNVKTSSKSGSVPTTPIQPDALYSSERFKQNRRALEDYQRKHGADSVRKVITAYTEPALSDTVPGTGSRDNPQDPTFGTVPTFHIPLPRRKTTPDQLQTYLYPAAQTCHDLPAKFPVDRGLQIDPTTGETVVWNLGREDVPHDFPQTQAPHCPVELDPFLPWIHDVVTAPDGQSIKFVAQNMRRCRTGPAQTDSVNRLVPQVTLMQAVSVQRINESLAQNLAPDLWSDESTREAKPQEPRYRLVPMHEASDDGKETRFICRFHMMQVKNGKLSTVTVGETLSVFPFNYEFLSYRKSMRSLLTPKGSDAALFWSSSLQFECPVPNHAELRSAIASGHTVLSDGTPTVHVDIAPIRTSVRYDEVYLTKDQIGPYHKASLFDPVERWGSNHVLPRFEASGRWANIPICNPPQLAMESQTPVDVSAISTKKKHASVDRKRKYSRKRVLGQSSSDVIESSKPHFLSACLWASAEFKQRGESSLKNTDTLDRIQEWIEFHLLAGFDHIYVYDNSGAHSNETTLEPTLSQYPASQVTRIDWPSTVCNNNRPSDESVGERSSQYAAETSCRVRYGPSTEWIASFDTDEYFVPMGNYTSLKNVLEDAQRGGTNILSFRSSRGKLRPDHSEPVFNDAALRRSPSSTFLEAYNCDSGGIPKPSWADRAKKQIYRTDYVLHHFVHYSTATRGIIKTYGEGGKWTRRYKELEPSEIFADELNQAVMVHTKSTNPIATKGYKKTCRFDAPKKWEECWVASPWPSGQTSATDTYNKETGLDYNCFINDKVEEYWIPRMKKALAKRRSSTTGN